MRCLRVDSPVVITVSTMLFAAGSLAAQAQSAPVLVTKFAVKLDTKSAKVGEAVSAKTVKAARAKDGTELPKGSKLTGQVVAVQSNKDGNGTASLAIKFDQVELKDGAKVPVQGLIVAIGPAPDVSGGGIGFNSVLGRDGVGSTQGLDPNTGAEHSGGGNDIPKGSTLEGVALARLSTRRGHPSCAASSATSNSTRCHDQGGIGIEAEHLPMTKGYPSRPRRACLLPLIPKETNRALRR